MSWMCDSCVHSPPGSEDGKPCAVCNPEDPTRSCYQAKRYGTGKYQDTAVLCPFYKHHDRKHIVICEGPMKRTTITLRFHRSEELKKHTRQYCELLYERCPLYQLTMKKYETGE